MKNYVGEKIVANLFFRGEAMGGAIHFDETGITFKPHALNIQSIDPIHIEYSEMTKIFKRNTLGIVPNGIAIATKQGFEYRFVIYNRKSVIEFIQSKLQVIKKEQ